MPNYEAITPELYKNKFWTQATNFRFAALDALCPIVVQEAPIACLHLPISFSKLGEHFGLFVLQGLEVGKNYLVDPEGNWLANYIPAAYRGYPFALADTGEHSQTLCVRTDSGLINNLKGNHFFNDQGKPSDQINEILHFLSSIAMNHKLTMSLCQLLEEMSLIEPWPITVKKNGEDMAVDGLFRINELKFNSIESNDLLILRNRGALPLIFFQLISMQNLSNISQLADAQSMVSAASNDLSFGLGSDEGNISFEDL